MSANAAEIRRGVYLKIRDEFNYNNVTGLSSNPPITQRATHRLEDPFIYIWSEDAFSVAKTKTGESYQYAVRIEVSTRANSNVGGQLQADQMAAEMYRIFDVPTAQYPNILDKGYHIYIVQFDPTASYNEEPEGGTYFRKVMTLLVTATYVGFDGTDIPVQLTSYNYNNWMYTPTVFDLERYDSGTIIPVTTYPNTGTWNFVDSSFAIGAGAQGTFANDIYTLDTEDTPVALSSTLNYSRGANPVSTHVVTTETTFSDSIATTVIEWTIAATTDPFPVYVPQMGDIWSNLNGMFIVEKDTPGGRLCDAVEIGEIVRFTWGAGSASFPVTGKGTRSIILGDAFDIVGTIGVTFSDGLLYTLEADVITSSTENYALMATTEWNRIGSLRFGVVESNTQPVFTDDTAASTGVRDLSNFQSSDDTIRFGTQNPIGETITFNGVEGQWMYIIIDKSQANLTGLIDSFNEDNLNFFENPVIVGEYKVYVQKRALSYTNTLTFTIQ